MAFNPKLCPYLDIPLQHVSDKVLTAMRRHTTSAQTRDIVRRLRETVPGLVLRTTMMVGHPGEGEAEFEELLDFVREARFERLGAFAYSEEEGTWGAAHNADSVPEELKQEIQNYVKSHTAPYKYPRQVVFRDELPKTISGKIMRNKL